MLIPRLSRMLVRRTSPLWTCLRSVSDLARPVYTNALSHGDKVAIIDTFGPHSYSQLYRSSLQLSALIRRRWVSREDRVAVLTGNTAQYVLAQWSVWMSGAVCVPLCKSHPGSTLSYYLRDSGATLILVSPDLHQVVSGLGVDVHVLEDEVSSGEGESEIVPERVSSSSPAMILYTSGTTGSPKGVVLSHQNLHSQTSCLVTAWGWTSADSLLHVLPLHHTHGIVNCLLCPLTVGATVHMLPSFCARTTWEILTRGEVNLFMAVPTIYSKLLAHHHSAGLSIPDTVSGCSSLRLMVSGSAALAVPVLEKWREVTGHELLERYGMTEIGMALSQPLTGHRLPGTVGSPLPGVEARLVSWSSEGVSTTLAEADHKTVSSLNSESGELLVRGPNVFAEYHDRPEATRKEFTEDGWFRTGDTAKLEDGVFRILGRTSVDIIKSGGYKISALDVETVLLTHEDIQEVAVVGLEDQTWGQRLAAVTVVRAGQEISLEELRLWCRDKMPKYWIPQEVKRLEEMPRNAMGKVNKKQLVKDVFSVQ